MSNKSLDASGGSVFLNLLISEGWLRHASWRFKLRRQVAYQ